MPSFLDRWDEVDRLLAEALELPPAERARFLDDACGNDPELRAHVERLLAIAATERTVLDAGAEALAVGFMDEVEAAVSRVGEQVGAYRIVRELGEGGMGTVYLAERADGAFSQQVALKIVRRDAATSEVLRRFRHERQVLASLHHPNIARLYDGGLSPDGLPYLVMEYVEGLPITEYCDRHRLTPRARLRLFATVCRAVQYAHQNLIVHRDLKPSNILVAEDGTVKLLDFGIAKLLDETPDLTVPVTRTGLHLMTPEYASPEQVRGEAVTTASDVYALGVLLYELLTGQRPYRIPRRLRHEVARIILEEEPTRPSTALTHAGPDGTPSVEAICQARATTRDHLQRQLRGDLDNIALKALAKEPDRRYGTVAHFNEDLRRYLDGLPVQARPATLGYRTRKFAQRHRTGLMAAAAVLVLIASLTGFYTLRLADERDRATLEAVKATRIKDFVLSLFEAADPDRRATATARDLLDAGTSRVDAHLMDEPEVRSEMRSVMALLYEKLGDYARADTLLQVALAERRTYFGEAHPLVADALYELGVVRRNLGRYGEADSLHRLALALRRQLLDRNDPGIAHSTNELGILAWQRGDYGAAEQMHRETLAIRRVILGDTSMSVSASLNNLALTLVDQGRAAEAIPLYEEALAIRRARLGNTHSRVATLLSNLALAYGSLGQLSRQEALYRETLAIRREIFGEDHPAVAHSLTNLAASVQNQGRLDEAETLFRESWAMRKKLLGERHPQTLTTQSRVAVVLQRRDRHEEAAALLRDALVHNRAQLGPEHPETAYVMTALGESLLALDQLAEAETVLQAAHAVNRARYGEAHRRTASSRNELARLRLAQHRPQEAEALFRDAIDDHRRNHPDQPTLADVLLDAAWFLLEQGRADEAEAQAREALAILEAAYGTASLQTAKALGTLGRCLADQQRYDEAESALTQSHALLAAHHGADHPATRQARQHLDDLARIRTTVY